METQGVRRYGAHGNARPIGASFPKTCGPYRPSDSSEGFPALFPARAFVIRRPLRSLAAKSVIGVFALNKARHFSGQNHGGSGLTTRSFHGPKRGHLGETGALRVTFPGKGLQHPQLEVRDFATHGISPLLSDGGSPFVSASPSLGARRRCMGSAYLATARIRSLPHGERGSHHRGRFHIEHLVTVNRPHFAQGNLGSVAQVDTKAPPPGLQPERLNRVFGFHQDKSNRGQAPQLEIPAAAIYDAIRDWVTKFTPKACALGRARKRLGSRGRPSDRWRSPNRGNSPAPVHNRSHSVP